MGRGSDTRLLYRRAAAAAGRTMSSAAVRIDVLADLRVRVREDERDALVVGADDQRAAGAHVVLRDAAQGAVEDLGIEAARGVRAVDEVADLGRRVADHPERVRHHHRAVDRRWSRR